MCSLSDILKPMVMAEHFCEEQNCSLCMSAIKTAQELVVKNFTPTNNAMPKLPPFNESMLQACPDELPGAIDNNAVLRGARAMYVYLERQLSA